MKLTPLNAVHLSLNAKMITTAAGYHMPAYYTSVEEEHRAVRERAGMIDISLMGRFDVKGRGAKDLLQKLAVNDAGKLADGQIMYTTFCDESGNIVDDVTVWKFNEVHYRVVTSSVMRQRSLKWVQRQSQGQDAYVTDVSSAYGCIAVQGPRSRDVLQKVSEADLGGLKFYRFTETKVAGIPAIIARVGYSGELGYECYTWAEDTAQAWRSIADAGKELGLQPYGLDVLDTLRYEKGFIFFGYEVTEKNNPFECGLDRWIRFEKPEFIGREALLRIGKEGPRQRLMGLEVEGDEAIPPSLAVSADGRKIGETLLGFRGLTVKKNLAWAFLDAGDAKEGTSVTIEADGKRTPARVVDIRCYDPQGARLKM